MEKKYISFDIEASGPTPGKYSMLSLGACVVGDISKQFYREVKPISRNYVAEAMRVSAKGLRCLDHLREIAEYDPASDKFMPALVLDVLEEKGQFVGDVMADYAAWTKEVTRGFRPVEAAAPIKFDSMFTTWYFDNYYTGENPFGHSGEDINSMYRGIIGERDASIRMLGIRKGDLPHNALEDAIIQAKEFEFVLSMLRK